MPQNSLPAPSLPEHSFSVANESCSGRKEQQKNSTPPTSTDQQASVSSFKMVAKLPLVSI